MSKIPSHQEKIAFMGTSNFAETALRKLYEAGYDVGLVVTKADTQKNRGKKVLPCAVKKAADELGIPTLQPDTLTGNGEVYETLAKFGKDLIVVAEYGKILPKNILNLPKCGCVNIHASLLPKFRGAAPIQRAIMAGDEMTGVTIMKMDEGLDTGAMIAKRSVPVGNKNTDELFEELANVGGDLLLDMLPKIFAGTCSFEVQNEEDATYANMIQKKEGELDFSKSPAVLERQIRAIPSYTYMQGELLKIWQSKVSEYALTEEESALPNGSVLEVTKNSLKIKCGGGALALCVLQLPGKKRLGVTDFLNGNRIDVHSILGQQASLT